MKLKRFSGLSFRNLHARFQRTLLTAIGIVLGVGIVFGVLTLSTTMSGTFEELFTRAYGSADLTVMAAGGSGGFDQEAVKEVRGYEGVVALGSLLGYLFVQGSGAGGFEIDFYYPKLPALAALLSGLFIGTFAGLLPPAPPPARASSRQYNTNDGIAIFARPGVIGIRNGRRFLTPD